MIHIKQILTSYEDTYNNLYYDGTEEEFSEILDSARFNDTCIRFCIKNQHTNDMNTLYIRACAITSLVLYGYKKIEAPVVKVVSGNNYQDIINSMIDVILTKESVKDTIVAKFIIAQLIHEAIAKANYEIDEDNINEYLDLFSLLVSMATKLIIKKEKENSNLDYAIELQDEFNTTVLPLLEVY